MAGYIGNNKLGNNGGRFYDFLNRPVLIDCSFVVDATNGNGLGIRSLKGSGVQNVFMHTTVAPGIGNNGIVNPNPLAGYAVIQLANNYNYYAGGFDGFVSPLSGANLAINAAALTIGQPYVISSVGYASAGSETITTVADVAGSLASTWFKLYDAYGNTFIVWFSVSGVGAAPQGVSGTLVQISIATGATAAQVATALNTVMGALLASQPGNLQAPAGVFSFTSGAVGAVVTLTSTQTNPFGPLPGVAADGTIPTGFAFALVNYSTNIQDWQGVGLQKGIVPALGAAFVATATGYSTGGGSTGLVQLATTSLISKIEVIGNPNSSIAPIPMGGSQNVGSWIIVQFLGPTAAGNTALIPTAPGVGSICNMNFKVEAGSILIAGE